MEQQVRVLHVTPSLNKSSGVATFVHNMHVACDGKIAFDYLHQAYQPDGLPIYDNTYDAELSDRGSSVYHVATPSAGIRRFISDVDAFFREHGSEYDVVHCHVANAAFCVLGDAKRAGVPVRILHSHLNTSSDKLSHRLRNAPLIAVGRRFATAYAACSEDAGKYLFGDRPFTLIRNGISIQDYVYSNERRAKKRLELGIPPNAHVVGCVGRIVEQKNHIFAVDVFSELLKTDSQALLLIVGDGVLRPTLEKRINDLGLSGKVILLGNRNDVNLLYSAMDTFFMPSLCEGLPFSAVEAQAAGLPCVYSTGVPSESDLTHTGIFLKLSDCITAWADALMRSFDTGRIVNAPAMLSMAGYSIESNAMHLMEFYNSLIHGVNS